MKAKRYDDFNFNSNRDIKEGSKLIWKSKNTIEKNIKLMTKSNKIFLINIDILALIKINIISNRK